MVHPGFCLADCVKMRKNCQLLVSRPFQPQESFQELRRYRLRGPNMAGNEDSLCYGLNGSLIDECPVPALDGASQQSESVSSGSVLEMSRKILY